MHYYLAISKNSCNFAIAFEIRINLLITLINQPKLINDL